MIVFTFYLLVIKERNVSTTEFHRVSCVLLLVIINAKLFILKFLSSKTVATFPLPIGKWVQEDLWHNIEWYSEFLVIMNGKVS